MKTKNITNPQKTDLEWLNLLIECANEADNVARFYFQKKSLSVKEKTDKTPVTEADTEIEKIIRKHVANIPNLGIYGEEFEKCDIKTPLKLIVDPIDGTSNFIRGIPIVGTLLAIEKDNHIIAGVVSNGIQKERWHAAKNQGAFFNNNPISVSKIDSISESQAFYGSLYGQEARGKLPILLNLLSQTKRQRGIGDFLIHTWVANGYGEIGIDFNLQPWDIAPLGLLVTEAGGTISQVNGNPFNIYEGSILSSNGRFHDDIVTLLNSTS